MSLERLLHLMEQQEWEQARRECEFLLASGNLDAAARVRVLAYGCRICTYLDDYYAAAKLGEEAMRGAQRLGDRRTELYVLFSLGVAHLWIGNTRDAIACFQEFLLEMADHGLEGWAPKAWHNLAVALRMLGDLEGAVQAQQEAVALWRRRGDRGGEGLSLVHIAWCHLLQGEPERAHPYLEAAEQCCLAAEDPYLEAHLAYAWALYHRQMGDLATSEHLCRTVFALSEDPEVIASTCWIAAENALERGDLERARRLADLAVEVAKRWPFPVVVERAYQILWRTRELLAEKG